MNEKKNSKINLLALLIIIVIIMFCFIFKLYNDKTIESENYSNLINQISNLEDPSEIYDPIMLEGVYAFENSDVGYEFDKEGNASIFGNVSEEKGTYTINENNEILITLTEKIIYDIETGDSSSEIINRIEKLYYIDENTLQVNNDNLIKISNDINDYASVSYIVLELEDIEAEERNQQGLEYKTKNITDKHKIENLMKLIDSATLYEEKSFIADFGDMPPAAEIYLSNGDHFRVFAGDEYNDNGDIVNLMCKYYNEDGSDKTLYKLNAKLGEYIENLFNE